MSQHDFQNAVDAFAPVAADTTLDVVPQLGGPAFPCGPRRTVSEHLRAVAEIDDSFFGEVDDGLLMIPPIHVIPPMVLLRAAVEAEAKRATRAMEEAADGLMAVDTEALNRESAMLREAPHRLSGQATCALTSGAAAALIARHRRPPQAPAALKTTPAAEAPEPLGTDMEVEIEVCERFSMSKVAERWVVLGSQPIASFLRSVSCSSDDLPFPRVGGDFMFVGGQFVVDPSDSAGHAAANAIASWDAGGSQPFRSCATVGSTDTFAKLALRVGDRGVWRHCGNCDHLLTVVDLRAVSGSRKSSAYPFRSHHAAGRLAARCDVCSAMPGSVLSYFDPLAPVHPAVYCVPCFRHLHGSDALTGEAESEMIVFRMPPGKHL
jgi:hypothetical protein